MSTKTSLTYADSGVSIDAGAELVRRIAPAAARTARPGVASGLGGFGALFDLKAAGYQDPILVAATDGVGTKLKIAIETGLYDGLGADLVAMCVNDLLCQGAEPLFFLDYYACGKLEPEIAARVVDGVAAACEAAGCALIGGETAEMPGLYRAGEFDLAGFAVGALERGRALPKGGAEAPRPGDALLALASDGAHANGFSLIRRIVADQGLAWDAPAPFAPETPLGAALLAPTRIYARPLKRALETPAGAEGLVGFAHITGGGLTENAPRALPEGTAAEIDLDSWTPPPLFAWLAEAAAAPEAEILRTFNCGVGMIAVCREDAAEQATESLRAAGETVWRIGRVVAADDPAPRYRGTLFA